MRVVAPGVNPHLNKYFATRRRLHAALVIGGAVSGSLFGAALTALGKIVADAPPASLDNYMWNMAVFGGMSAILSPIVTWSALRRAPLWRTVLEPLAAGVAGAGVAALAGFGPGILLLPPIALAASLTRLVHVYRETGARAARERIAE